VPFRCRSQTQWARPIRRFGGVSADVVCFRSSQRTAVEAGQPVALRFPATTSRPPSSSGLGLRPFTAAARVRIPLGVRRDADYGLGRSLLEVLIDQGPVAQLVSAPPCHGGGRGFKSRRGRQTRAGPQSLEFEGLGSGLLFGPGSSVGTSVRLKSGRSPVRSRPWPPHLNWENAHGAFSQFCVAGRAGRPGFVRTTA
jgi:hypothetical protein